MLGWFRSSHSRVCKDKISSCIHVPQNRCQAVFGQQAECVFPLVCTNTHSGKQSIWERCIYQTWTCIWKCQLWLAEVLSDQIHSQKTRSCGRPCWNVTAGSSSHHTQSSGLPAGLYDMLWRSCALPAGKLGCRMNPTPHDQDISASRTDDGNHRLNTSKFVLTGAKYRYSIAKKGRSMNRIKTWS